MAQEPQTRRTIPEPLWQAAAKLAADYGVSAVAGPLALDYYALKERLDRLDGQSVSNAPFIELPPMPRSHASECVIELQDGMGASMRMHLKGGELPDVLALGRSVSARDRHS